MHLTWYLGGVLVGFAVPFVFASTLNLHHDLYYLIYFTAIAGFLAAYVAATRLNVVEFAVQRWRWSLGLGVIAAAVVVAGVLAREDATARPDGLYMAFQVLWRGAFYGVVDALLLSAFPVAVAFAVHKRRLGNAARRVSFVVLSSVLVLVITGAYHLGYDQFREDGIGGPEIGNSIISVPAIATINPLGSVIAHSSMHIAAVIHAYETETYLPPQRDAD